MAKCIICCVVFFFKILFIYSWETQRKKEAETQAEGEAGSMQGARHGTWSRVSKITPRAEGSAKLLSHPGCPNYGILIASKLGVNFQSFISYLFFNNSVLVGIENLRTEKLLKKMLTHELLIHIIFLRFYLFIRRDRERERERRRSRPHSGSPMWDSTLGLQDHTPGCRWS